MRVSWIVLLIAGTTLAQTPSKIAVCRQVAIEGEVSAGKGFERVIGGGLKVGLEPTSDGWAVRVVPAAGRRGEHDYAELATPPYRSLSPLMISTGLGFRAQDAVGWNPRRFRYAATPVTYTALQSLYDRYLSAKVSPADDAELARRVSESPEGTLLLLDARIIPGTGDQIPAAGQVASHFDATAHTIDQPAGNQGTPLGKLEWIKFRFVLDLPSSFTPAPGLRITKAPCVAN